MMKAGITKMATKSRYEAYAKSMKEKKDIKAGTAPKKSVLEALKNKKAQIAKPAMM